MFPFTINDTQAIQGVDSEVGLSPDIIRTFIPVTDDLCVIGCDHSIYRLTGDPATPGAQFHPISTTVGMAFGKCWAKDPQGRIYFFGSLGGVYAMDPAALGIVDVSKDSLPAKLADIDLEVFRVEMAWSDKENGLRVMVVEVGDDDEHVESFFWDRDERAWYVDEYGPASDTGVQPTCVATLDGDATDDRMLVFGCTDGEVRIYDETALNDDGEVIDSTVMFGPLVPEEVDAEFMVTDLEIVTKLDEAGPNWFLYASETADDPGEAMAHGFVRQGRAPMVKARVRGAALWIRLGLASLTSRWSLESLAARFVKMGRKGTLVP
jgi:hypothetical protein